MAAAVAAMTVARDEDIQPVVPGPGGSAVFRSRLTAGHGYP